jgi:hypothetical protein
MIVPGWFGSAFGTYPMRQFFRTCRPISRRRRFSTDVRV